jgi:transcriptional regulator with XRE-family HTH domain
MDEQENVWITARIGAALRKAREDRGMTQAELAGLVAASQPQIANYEHGGHDMPLSRLFDIARVLGVVVGDLLAD